jgi:replicative DNA helicase
MDQNKKRYAQQQPDHMKVVQLHQGMVMPQAIDIEQAVLGVLMIDMKCQDECLMILKSPDVFYTEQHQVIFEAIQALYDAAEQIDMLTVPAKLRTMGKLEVAGGDYYIITLTQKISSGAHIEYYSRILLQMYIKRQIIKNASAFAGQAYLETVDSLELLQQWSDSLDNITAITMTGGSEISYAKALDIVEKRIEQLSHKQDEALTGIDTGFRKINEQTAGYQPGELIIVAARPGMGKSAYMLRPVLRNASKGIAVGIISLEMSVYEIASRTVAIDTNFHLKQITKEGFTKPEYFTTFSKHKHRMNAYPILMDDSAKSDIRDIVATLRLWKRKHNIGFAVIDYLQLITDSTKGGNREQEVASISRKLKMLCKELSIPMMVLSQLSRAVETRGSSKRPLLSDLRESGAIEQDANIVTFLYRPEYYKIEPDDELLSIGADSEAIFAKYRGGAPFEAGLKWIGDHTKYIDPDEYLQQQEALQQQQQQHAEPWKEKPLPATSPNDAFGPRPGNSVQDVSDKDDLAF